MTKKIFLSLMAVLGLLLSAHAQEREITGSVKDHAGAGIVGATILVEGTTKGTTSGADGSFSIKAAPDNVLVVSFMGYQSHTIKVGTQTRIDVVLKEDTQAIDRAEGRRLELAVRRPRRQRRGDDHHQKGQVAGGSRDNRRQVGRQFARRPGLCVHHQPGTILRTALQCAEKLLCQFGNEYRRGPFARQYEFDGQCE